jgi:SAM-dependent methyltransferase
MNVDAVWHDLECGGYSDDLALWRALAASSGGPVLDVGAGTGRVTLELASRGVEVVALDIAPRLLAALDCRAAGMPVETVCADAREFRVDRHFSLIVVPMQTLQLFGAAGRESFLRCAFEHLMPGGLLAAALADAMDCFDEEHDLPPPADACEILGVRYASQLVGVAEERGRAAIRRRREIARADDRGETQTVVVHLDRVSPDEVAAEARRLGFVARPCLHVPESEQYLGSTVVVLQAPPAGGSRRQRSPRQPAWKSRWR